MGEEKKRGKDDFDVPMERFLERARRSRKLESVDGLKPLREEVHDRAGLR